MSDGRLEILARIREALSVPSDPAVRDGHGDHGEAAPPDSTGNISDWLPPVGESHDQRVTLFTELSEKLRTRFVTVENERKAHELLSELAAENNWSSLASHHDPLTEAACEALGLPVLWTEKGYDRDALEKTDAALSTCEALIAQTGSVLVTTACGGRALSVLPPHHVVLARADQLLPDLPAGFALLREKYAGNWPSFMSLITGPSRTGDIERILVLGAHGPRQLTVILING